MKYFSTLMIVSFFLIPNAMGFQGGDGSSSNPYEITSCSELSDIRNDRSAAYELKNNVNCGGYGDFTPIDSFDGEFDGDGFVISELTINHGNGAGLFGNNVGGKIHDLGIHDSNVNGNAFTGVLAGEGGGEIYRVYVKNSVSDGTDEVGNIFGHPRHGDAQIRNTFTIGGEARNGGVDTGGHSGQPGSGSISKSYSRTPTGGNGGVLIGYLSGGSEFNNYWGTDLIPGSSDGGTGLSKAEMRQESNYNNWDFTNVWRECSRTDARANYGFPFLRGVGNFWCAAPNPPNNPDPSDGSNTGERPDLSVYYSHDDGKSGTLRYYETSDNSINPDTDNFIDSCSVTDGSRCSVEFSSAQSGTYKWYAIADDTARTTSSNIYEFTPNRPPDSPSNPSPGDNADPVELSPTLNVDISDPDGDSMDVTFHVDTDNDGNHEYTDTDFGVGSGGTASTSLSSLATSQVVDWYVVADDGDQTKQSTERNFTTVSRPEMPSDPVPGNESINVTTDSDLKVNVSHPDGLNLNVDFYIDENRDGSTDQILTDSNVESGGTASVNPALESLEQYSWYTRARTDGFSTERSSEKWKFNTSDGYEVQLSWNDLSKNEAGFKVFTNASGSWQETGETQRNSETFTDQNPNIALGEYVCFGVQAFNTVGYSDAVERCKTIE